MAHLNSVHVVGNYNVSKWTVPAAAGYDEYKNGGIYFMDYSFYSDSFSLWTLSVSSLNEPYFALISNQKGGSLTVTDLYFGVGAHFSVLWNEGTVSAERVRTGFADDGSAYFDRWNLRPNSIITNNFGTLRLSDSDIVGADSSLIDVFGGDVVLSNVSMAQAMGGVVTHYSADNISMERVHLFEIGAFYASFGAATFHSPSSSLSAPCHLSARSVSVRKCEFSYIDLFGVLEIAEYGRDQTQSEGIEIKSR